MEQQSTNYSELTRDQAYDLVLQRTEALINQIEDFQSKYQTGGLLQ
jgi:hypothetical protein